MKSRLLSTAATTRNSRRRCWRRFKPIRATHELKVEVAAADGTVTLSGTVPSYGLKMLAGEVAMGTKGVAELKNDLLVDSKQRLTDDGVAEGDS